ncbi:MAG: DUF2075 domain-containing protein [Terriglobales bacterium]
MVSSAAAPLLPRAWFATSIAEFLAMSATAVLGELTAHSEAEVRGEQRTAWLDEIEILRAGLPGINGHLFLEFNIPRMGHRADAVVLAGAAVFVLEFKSEQDAGRGSLNQVWDYALDLKNFHQASHPLPIVPILITPGATGASVPRLEFAGDGVAQPVRLGGAEAGTGLAAYAASIAGPAIDGLCWQAAPYHPTPTIIEAARNLYAGQTVAELAHSEAGGESLRRTTERILTIAQRTRGERHKAICFITGVPGAGKTLVGLDLATRRDSDLENHAVYLSGNGPLVEVLRAALQQDANRRSGKRTRGSGPPSVISQEIKTFIQNVHHFRSEGLRNAAPPPEHVVIFDEAQRAWNRQKLASWLKQRKGIKDFRQSEPEALLAYATRREDWLLVVCLVGGGQEINQGEAGIGNWLETVAQDGYAAWDVWMPPKLADTEYSAGGALAALGARPRFDPDLHLAVSVRSFRAENLSAFVHAVLDGNAATARAELAQFLDRYPIALTRNLQAAKDWVRGHARGNERFGLLATSKAIRLKPHAIDVRVDVDPVQWFLQTREDTRSSFYLEDAATEFDVQGLELDWTCVTWDGDLRHNGSGWTPHDFRGSKWNAVRDSWAQLYARNAYRVLLTRARQGMAIFVPPGDAADPTRPPAFYDPTFNYLASLGLPVLA